MKISICITKKDPTCTCGKAVQTTDHPIFECETLTKKRKRQPPYKKATGQSTKKFNKEAI
jgi:hypothetical protein